MSTSARAATTRQKVFISYAHEDEVFRDELVKHLRLLERENLIEIWHDRKISPGQDWSQTIHEKLESATVFIMLISADFINSDYCYGIEMTAALNAAQRGAARVLPVLVKHTAFESAPFARFQMLPRDGVPVTDFPSRDKAWSEIADAVRTFATGSQDDTPANSGEQAELGESPPTADWKRLGDALLARLRSLDRSDDWVDRRFTDLAAEIEAEGTNPKHRWERWFHSRGRELRRVPSLHEAIITTSDRLSLVVGEPGSGKSVAMRHAARQILQHATASGHALLPLYVNLRDFSVSSGALTAHEIHDYVVTASCRELDDEAAGFLRRYFNWALTSGRLLILLDSFDEIPEVLGSGEPDATVTKYAEAIYTFANGMHDSRVVVSSRLYRGPGRMRWPQLRILPLGEERRRAFIRAWFDDDASAEVVRREFVRAVDLDGWIDNPLLLALLCAYRKAHGTLPSSAHEAFESFVTQRISALPEILQKYRLSPEELRMATEEVAFTMNADHSIGLAPEIDALAESMRRRGVTNMVNIDVVVACLVELHLGRASLEPTSQRRVFSFFHRRVQEYFCTCFALRCSQQLDVPELITNERWRETVVTLLQTAHEDAVRPLLRVAQENLRKYDAQIQHSVCLPLRDLHAESPLPNTIDRLRALHGPRPFPWPPGLIHLLGILSDSRVSGGAPELESVRRCADPCILAALALGLRFDQATALQVSGAMSSGGRKCALSWAFTSDSRWLEDIAFQRSSYLAPLPPLIVARIGSMLVLKALTGELRRDRTRIEAQIRRLDVQARLLETFQALRRVIGLEIAAIGAMVGSMIVYAYFGHGSVVDAALNGGLFGVLVFKLGVIGVRRRALRQWHDHLPNRESLAMNALIALGVTVARTTVPASMLAYLSANSRLTPAVTIVTICFIALVLGHRPGVYFSTISGRVITRSRELIAGLQPVVLLVEGLATRAVAVGIILFVASVIPILVSVPSFRTPPPDAMSPAGIVSAAVLYGVGLGALLVYGGCRLADSTRLRRCRRRKDARSAIGVLDEAAMFSRKDNRNRYFRWIRENQLIAATRPNERVLVELLSALEDVAPAHALQFVEFTGNNGDPKQESNQQASDFERWFTAHAATHRRGLKDWTRSVDELAQLIDQLRARLGT